MNRFSLGNHRQFAKPPNQTFLLYSNGFNYFVVNFQIILLLQRPRDAYYKEQLYSDKPKNTVSLFIICKPLPWYRLFHCRATLPMYVLELKLLQSTFIYGLFLSLWDICTWVFGCCVLWLHLPARCLAVNHYRWNWLMIMALVWLLIHIMMYEAQMHMLPQMLTLAITYHPLLSPYICMMTIVQYKLCQMVCNTAIQLSS